MISFILLERKGDVCLQEGVDHFYEQCFNNLMLMRSISTLYDLINQLQLPISESRLIKNRPAMHKLNIAFNKAKSTLGFIKRWAKEIRGPYTSRSLCILLVNPFLEFCSIICHSHYDFSVNPYKGFRAYKVTHS